MTITNEDAVYEALVRVLGHERVGEFVVGDPEDAADLAAGYYRFELDVDTGSEEHHEATARVSVYAYDPSTPDRTPTWTTSALATDLVTAVAERRRRLYGRWEHLIVDTDEGREVLVIEGVSVVEGVSRGVDDGHYALSRLTVRVDWHSDLD